MNEDYRKGYRDGFKDGIESEQERANKESSYVSPNDVPSWPIPNTPYNKPSYQPYDYWYLLVKCEVCGKTGMVGNCGKSNCPQPIYRIYG